MFFRILIYLLILSITFVGSIKIILYTIDLGDPQGPPLPFIIALLFSGTIAFIIDDYLIKYN